MNNTMKIVIEEYIASCYYVYVENTVKLLIVPNRGTCHCYIEKIPNDFKAVSTNYQDYFENWLHPTEEEMIAFLLEHNIDY